MAGSTWFSERFIRAGLQRAAAALAGAMFSASAAFALSCPVPDIVANYEYARQSTMEYVIARGRLSTGLGETRYELDGGAITYTRVFRFDGAALSGRYFATPFSSPITYRWFDEYSLYSDTPPENPETVVLTPPEGDVIVFLQRVNGALYLVQGACGAEYFAASAANIRKVLQCHRGERCVRAED